MATVKRPGSDRAEVPDPEEVKPTPKPKKDLGYHTVKGGTKFPIVDRYWSKSARCVIDVYEKTRHVRSRDDSTGEMVMRPGVKTYVKTYSQDVGVQYAAADRFGVDIAIDLEEHWTKMNVTESDAASSDRVEL